MSPLRWRDYLSLGIFSTVLFGFALVNDRVLTTHETVHCQNTREMRAGGDWLIPHYGGRPWLERPPLPFWITMALVEVFGDAPWTYRLAPLLMGLAGVFLVAWLASAWYGRHIGLLSGLILATLQEYTHYATGPEADIFLCTVVTAALALFVHLEFQCRPAAASANAWRAGSVSDRSSPVQLGFFSRRPWALLFFFMVLGATNLVKGLFFGTIFVLLPIGCFLLWNLDWSGLRRYVWLWGWLGFLLVAAAWPLAAYLRYPDILDFWKSDYLGRVNQGYMREPFWYYFVHLPWNIFPWTIPGLFGLWLVRKPALHARSPERLLCCWALVPVLFFSIPQGKHHHYLLQCMAPWAVLGALGAVRLWELARETAWLQHPWRGLLLLGLPGDIAILAAGHWLPGPSWLVPVLLVAWPACACTFLCVLMQRDGRLAVGTIGVLLAGLYCAANAYRTNYFDRYRHDSAFVHEALASVPNGKPILVLDDDAPLNASWLLFYVGERARLLHNVTFLLDEQIQDADVYLIARRKLESTLALYGSAQVLGQSERSRYEKTPADRYTLFRVCFHGHLARQPRPRISPMQATGRAEGPFMQ